MWISTSKTAKLLHVSTETLRRMAADGRLDGVRRDETPGGHARYWQADVEALAAGTLARPVPAAQIQQPPDGATQSPPAAPTPESRLRRMFRVLRPSRRVALALVAMMWLVGSYAATWQMWEDYDERMWQSGADGMLVNAHWYVALSYQVPQERFDEDCLRYMRTIVGIRDLVAGDLEEQGLSLRDAKFKKATRVYLGAHMGDDMPELPDNSWTRFLDSPWGVLAWPARQTHHDRFPARLKIQREALNDASSDDRWAARNRDACKEIAAPDARI